MVSAFVERQMVGAYWITWNITASQAELAG
jgi:hypothetical protein